MSSFITIGFVFDIHHRSVKEAFERFLDFLVNKETLFLNMKFSMDIDGEQWVEKNINQRQLSNKEKDMFFENYFSVMKVNFQIAPAVFIDTIIFIEKKENIFGFCMDIDEENLLLCLEGLQNTENKVIAFITNGYKYLNYEYAFCDHEIEEIYGLLNIDDKYSLLIKPEKYRNKTNLSVKKAMWMIDGLSQRQEQ